MKKVEDTITRFQLEGFAKQERELFEHFLLEELGGVKKLSNQRNPIGDKRKWLKDQADKIFKFCK